MGVLESFLLLWKYSSVCFLTNIATIFLLLYTSIEDWNKNNYLFDVSVLNQVGNHRHPAQSTPHNIMPGIKVMPGVVEKLFTFNWHLNVYYCGHFSQLNIFNSKSSIQVFCLQTKSHMGRISLRIFWLVTSLSYISPRASEHAKFVYYFRFVVKSCA